mgnify:FL=1
MATLMSLHEKMLLFQKTATISDDHSTPNVLSTLYELGTISLQAAAFISVDISVISIFQGQLLDIPQKITDTHKLAMGTVCLIIRKSTIIQYPNILTYELLRSSPHI